MTISSRTPEGFPAHCPLCGADTNLEFSDPAGDAPCPNCGCLLWTSADLLAWFQQACSETLSIPADEIDPQTVLDELQADSIDVVELVMRMESESTVVISEEDYERLRTVGDAVRYIEQRRRDG